MADERHRSVARERVGIKQDSRLGVKRIGDEQDVLILQATIVLVEVSAALLFRDAVTLVVPELHQTLVDGMAVWDLIEIVKRQFVLGFDPGTGIGGIGVFEATIGIGHLGSVVVVDLVDGFGMWVGKDGRRRGVISDKHGHGEN